MGTIPDKGDNFVRTAMPTSFQEYLGEHQAAPAYRLEDAITTYRRIYGDEECIKAIKILFGDKPLENGDGTSR